MAEEYPISIKFSWDSESTAYFISRLITQVNKKNIEFKLTVKQGSIITDILIAIAAGIPVGVFIGIATIIVQAAMSNAKERGKKLDLPTITENGREIDIQSKFKEIDSKIDNIERKTLKLPDKSVEETIEKLISRANKGELERISNLVNAEKKKRNKRF